MKAKKYLIYIQIKNRQRALNKKYEKDGLTDEILKEQFEINKLRHQHNITDKNKRVYDNYTQ